MCVDVCEREYVCEMSAHVHVHVHVCESERVGEWEREKRTYGLCANEDINLEEWEIAFKEV